jgi:ABC-2 type transport system ATP-binding protein
MKIEPPAIAIKNLVKKYKKGSTAVDNISFDVAQGDFFALLGPNGAGKSTTIGMISSLVNISAGSIEILGADLVKRPSQAKRNLGVMPQEVNLNVFEKAMDILYHQASYYGMTRQATRQQAEHLLKAAELWEHRDAKVATFSGGMKRRLMVARALIHSPKILILDEPTAGVDIEIRQSMWDFLRKLNQQGLTIILTTHYLEEAENLCNRIAIINHGKLLHLANMNELLASLETESFILDCQNLAGKNLTLDLDYQQIDAQSLEVALPKDVAVGHLICQLNDQGVQVQRIRNKRNRLEQLFLDLIQANEPDQASHTEATS